VSDNYLGIVAVFDKLISARIIGEDKTLCIKFGAEAGDPSTHDIIFVRGISSEVDRAVKDIRQIVQNAKNDEIVNSYVRSYFSFRDQLVFKPNLTVYRIRR
jgi:hypothetical protein